VRESRTLGSLGAKPNGLATRPKPSEAWRDLPTQVQPTVMTIRLRDYSETWLARRKALGVGMVSKERRNLELYVLGAIGALPLRDVRPSQIRSILDEAIALGRKRATVAHIHGVLRRLFSAAIADELIEQSPVAAVRVPKMRAVRKERAVLTDAEFARFIACAEVDLELRMLSLVARCEGGMRTGDLHRWDWSQIDRTSFAECIVPRAKTGTPQALAIPSTLAPFLRSWWERARRPESGPVFPARVGKRAGSEKRPLTSYAKRLRRGLLRAGVWRLPPVEVPATRAGMRTDLGKHAPGTKTAPNPRDPLYFETEATLPVDFHSFRRAFASALAEAGVNVQHAMHLTAHSDPRVHARYVMRTTAMRTIPEAAIPRLHVGVLVVAARRDESAPQDGPVGARIVIASDDSPKNGLVRWGGNEPSSRYYPTNIAPAVGLEPTTRRLTESKRESRISGTLQKQPDRDARGSEIHRTQPHVAYSVAHSVPQNAEHLAAAIANLTRLLALVDDPAVAADLVRERAALREELAAATGRVAGVVRLARSRP
jgi:integrase